MQDKPEQTDPRSWLRRLIYTPFRDLVHGRITGELDVAYLYEAQLGQPLTKHLARILTGAGLFPKEKLTAADDLAGQFQRELARGSSADQIIQQNKPGKIRKSIRKQYVRRRRWYIRSLPNAIIGLVLIVYAYEVWETSYYYRSHPVVRVDYVALLNDRAEAVPEPDRAWPLYREALFDSCLYLPDIPLHAGLTPEHPGWTEVDAFLAVHRASVDQLRRAALMPGLGFSAGYHNDISEADARAFGLDYDGLWHGLSDAEIAGRNPSDDGLVAVLLPHLGAIRLASNFLTADTYQAVDHNDPDGFCENISAILNMADHAAEVRMRICGLVAINITNTAYYIVNDVLMDSPGFLRDEHLLQIQQMLDRGTALRLISVEDGLYSGLDWVQRTYSDDGRGGGHITPEWITGYSSGDDGDTDIQAAGVMPRINAAFYLAGGGI